MVKYQEVEGTFTARYPQDLEHVAPVILSKLGKYKIWLFEGEMGAGKTTLIKAICQEMGVSDMVNSPTYGLVHEYQDHSQQSIYHFDFYRLNREEEAREIGVEEYFYSGSYCLIEWGARIASFVPKKHAKILLEVRDDGSRIIAIEKHD